MKKKVLTYGFIAGGILSLMMLGTLAFVDRVGFKYGEVIGYSTMVLSFLLVFFGIRSYREDVGDGYISFWRALGVGLLMMLIACVCYVVTWEFIYIKLFPDFVDKYGAYILTQLRDSGATQQVIDAKIEELKQFKVMYDNPLINSALTFLEPLPVGLLMTVISAAILRKKPKPIEPLAEAA
jgi:hypothetical protein